MVNVESLCASKQFWIVYLYMLYLYQLLLNLCQNGRVPLHYAADGGRIEAIRALVREFNCPPDCRDNVSDFHSPNYGPAWLDTVHCAALMVHYETAVYCRYYAAGKVVHVCIFQSPVCNCPKQCIGRGAMVIAHAITTYVHVRISCVVHP